MKLTQEEKDARREARKEARKAKKEAARIEAERNQKPVESITISIEWKKSRTWGSNPHAEAAVRFQDGTFERRNGYTASGCGYDKESTVIADIFNDFLKYKLWNIEKLIENKRRMYNLPVELNTDDKVIPYGIYSGPQYRSFSGGIGTNCYYAIAEFIGGKFETVASGKTFDVFKYTDGTDKPA